jgi:hypothetical protein
MSAIYLSELHYYPIKSCRSLALTTALVTQRGLLDDRLLMLVGADDYFLTQREHPRMALIAPELLSTDKGHLLTLHAPDMPALTVAVGNRGARRQVQLWDDLCLAVDQGDEVADWLSHFLGAQIRLVRMADEFQRWLRPRTTQSPPVESSFADGLPLLLIAQASLDDLNGRLVSPLPMNRFRPNLVVQGCPAFAEDQWRRIRVGALEFDVVKPCVRCQLITVDQESAAVGKEPLATLSTYRRIDGKVMFGQKLVSRSTGLLHVGDPVEVLI